jgi:hypothetical protein
VSLEHDGARAGGHVDIFIPNPFPVEALDERAKNQAQDQPSRSKGFTSLRAPNLGKSRLMFVWYPMSRANMQDSVNPKPLMVGIAEEPRRQ